MLLVVSNVALRPFGKPITPTYELVEIMAAAAISFAVLYATVERAHIVINILVSRLPQQVRAIFDSFTSFLGFGTWALLAIASAIYAWEQWLLIEITDILDIPYFPFRCVWVFAMAIMCLVLLIQLSEALTRVRRK